jgi:hypothetical protein
LYRAADNHRYVTGADTGLTITFPDEDGCGGLKNTEENSGVPDFFAVKKAADQTTKQNDVANDR